jgi:hypothetical protein
MSYPGSKIFTFIIGIFFGMLAALGLVFLIMNQFNPFAAFGHDSSSSSRDTLVDMRVSNKRKPSTKAKPVMNFEEIADATDTEQSEESSNLKENQGLVINEVSESGESDIVVRRDEFIVSRELPLIKIKPDAQKQKRDSVLRQLQGSNPQSNNFRIEYWRSPLNYRGYKMIRSTIVAFGLPQEESAQLYSLNDVFYLKHGVSVYRLYETEVFLPFKREIDDELLKQLKQ